MEAKDLNNIHAETQRLYYEDSHLKSFEAVVLSCTEKKGVFHLVLDRTAFFPEGGGQAGDRGTLNDVEVFDTHEKDGQILHYTRTAIEPGTPVTGTLYYAERFDKMQQHSAEHIVSGLVHTLFGYDNVGFHLGADLTTLDFNGEFTAEQLSMVEEKANEVVFSNLDVLISYPSREERAVLNYRSKLDLDGVVRIVTFPGIDLCACCAPHVKKTGEIGIIKLVSCDRHRGGSRITMVAGKRALADYTRKFTSVTEISSLLSSKPELVTEYVIRLQESALKLRHDLERFQNTYLTGKLADIRPEDLCVCLFEEELDNIALRNFINNAVERCGGICAGFVGTEENGYRYILGSKTKDMRQVSKALNTQFHGKGGGKPEMVQGSLTGTESDIREALLILATE